jgi:hypothetical protein
MIITQALGFCDYTAGLLRGLSVQIELRQRAEERIVVNVVRQAVAVDHGSIKLIVQVYDGRCW